MRHVFDILSREGQNNGYTFVSPAFGELLLHCIGAGDLSIVSGVGWFLVRMRRDPCLSSETIESMTELAWLIAGRIRECDGLDASVDLLLALFDEYPVFVVDFRNQVRHLVHQHQGWPVAG
jgi:hypothetical protein